LRPTPLLRPDILYVIPSSVVVHADPLYFSQARLRPSPPAETPLSALCFLNRFNVERPRRHARLPPPRIPSFSFEAAFLERLSFQLRGRRTPILDNAAT